MAIEMIKLRCGMKRTLRVSMARDQRWELLLHLTFERCRKERERENYLFLKNRERKRGECSERH
jgi:hypothetical protein